MQASNRVDRVLSQLNPNYTAAQSKDASPVSLKKIQGAALITINFPPVNSFHPSVQAGLESCVKAAYADEEVKALIITGSGINFMAGADIPFLQQMQQDDKITKQDIINYIKKGNELMNLIESGPKPTVACINGVALGGGCELAMACNARVIVQGGVMGLPELSLGIIPGLGGTQRLPRLVGVKMAVESTLGSKKIKAAQALKAGLVDAVAKPNQMAMVAGKLAMELATGKRPVRRSLYLTDKLVATEEAKVIVDGARIQSAKKVKNVPHPAAYLDAVWEGLLYGGEKGLAKETDVFADLVKTPTAKGLVHFFLSSRATSKIPGVPEKSDAKIKKVAVIGGGTMGAGIVLVYLMKGYTVYLKEINEKALLAGVERIVNTVSIFLKRRRLPSIGAEQIMRGLIPTTTYEGFEDVDLVIEAVIENVPLKQQIFADLERICKKTCILATNTSTIDLELIGAKTKAQDRIIGLHFFSPAHVMPLLEIVRTKHTSAATISACVENSKRIGKTPVVVGNCVGFTANRAFFPYGQAAAFLVDAGIDPYRIDAALEKWGMPMGVFKMGDLSGVDIFYHVSNQINGAYGNRCYNSTLGKRLMDAKRLGQKTALGYYKYNGRKTVPDMAGLKPFLDAARADSKLPAIKDITDEQIVEMIIYPIVNECYRIFAEGMVVRESDIDICAVMGYGFPAYRGGLMFLSKQVGVKRVAERLAHFSQTYGAANASVKAFFAPSDALLQIAAKSN